MLHGSRVAWRHGQPHPVDRRRLLQRARQAALWENTSVNALVRDFSERYVDARTRRLQALAAFEAVANGSHSVSSGPWNRITLHQRH